MHIGILLSRLGIVKKMHKFSKWKYLAKEMMVL